MHRRSVYSLPPSRALGWAAALVVAFWGALPGWANPVEVSTYTDGSLKAAGLRVSEGAIRLTLDEAISIALSRNLGLVVERYGQRQLGLGIDQEKGFYDLLLSSDLGYSENSSLNSNRLVQADSITAKNTSLSLGLAQKTPWGGSASFSFSSNRRETSDPTAIQNPSYNANARLGISQSLLKGFGREATDRGLLVARLADKSGRQGFEIAVADLIQRVEDAYWEVVEARNQLNVAQEGLALAEELHRRNKIQVEVGTSAPLELIQSEATVASRQVDIIQAKTRVGNANDSLRQLLNLEQGEAWDLDVIPETDPASPQIEVTLAEGIAAAIKTRPEILRQNIEVERLQLLARIARNQALPTLDLTAGYGASGLAGTIRNPNPGPGEPAEIKSDFSDALKQLRDRDFDGWSVGLSFSYPLQNRSARAAVALADIDVGRAKTQLAQLEQQVITEVRTAVRQVQAAWQQIQSAGISRRLQEKNLQAEQKRYENGMSTSFQVTQIQDDLTLAKSQEVSAIASYRRALAGYYRSIGSLLRETGVQLVQPGPPAATK
ncbi:MAG: TolC family protein [Thermoanaerobaculia bacterium]